LRDRTRAIFTAAIGLGLTWSVMVTAPVSAASLKVVVIVGPTGQQTDSYRSTANQIAQTATAAGATVVKVYSPKATWGRVRNAVDGANVIVYLGHGNGYPNPYSSGTEWTDRVNGWGLNRTTSGGDSDDWSTKMVYCGEKALLGTLTAADGPAQWNRCGGKTNTDGIHPAANFVMIYNKACYTPGASEGWDTKATETKALQHVRNYSYPVLKLGAGAYFATDTYHGGSTLVDLVLRNRTTPFGAIAEQGSGYDEDAQRHFDHPDLVGRRIWIQRTTQGMGTDYWYAYAGNPSLTPSGDQGTYFESGSPRVVGYAPRRDATSAAPTAVVKATFDQPVTGVNAGSVVLKAPGGDLVSATVTYNADLMRARLEPAAPLAHGATYTVVLRSAITNLDGLPLSRTLWHFTVKAAA
jgi:hypothetical protein